MADPRVSVFLALAEYCDKQKCKGGSKFWAVKLVSSAETSCRLSGSGSDNPGKSTSALRLIQVQIGSSTLVTIEPSDCLR